MDDDAPLAPYERGPLVPGDPHAKARPGTTIALEIDPVVVAYVIRHNLSLQRFLNEAALALIAVRDTRAASDAAE